jgi:hypothetical protein
MSPRIYVGGLPSPATDARLCLLCVPHRTVKSTCVIKVNLLVTSSC